MAKHTRPPCNQVIVETLGYRTPAQRIRSLARSSEELLLSRKEKDLYHIKPGDTKTEDINLTLTRYKDKVDEIQSAMVAKAEFAEKWEKMRQEDFTRQEKLKAEYAEFLELKRKAAETPPAEKKPTE